MRRSLVNARTLVTGASGGIGRAIAIELARAGCDVVLVARRAEELEETARAIEDLDRRAVLSIGDVAKADDRAAALAAAEHQLGGLDILVNNAGVSAHGPFAEASAERLRQIMEVNFFAATELTRAALPILRRGRTPVIVNVGSILGHRGIPFNSEYCASKFALRGWSEALRAELVADNIGVLVVSPGTTDTKFFEHLIERRPMPWKQTRGVTPEYVARATVRAIERGKHEIIPSNRGRVLVWLNRLSGRLVDWMMGRYGRG